MVPGLPRGAWLLVVSTSMLLLVVRSQAANKPHMHVVRAERLHQTAPRRWHRTHCDYGDGNAVTACL